MQVLSLTMRRVLPIAVVLGVGMASPRAGAAFGDPVNMPAGSKVVRTPAKGRFEARVKALGNVVRSLISKDWQRQKPWAIGYSASQLGDRTFMVTDSQGKTTSLKVLSGRLHDKSRGAITAMPHLAEKQMAQIERQLDERFGLADTPQKIVARGRLLDEARKNQGVPEGLLKWLADIPALK